MAIQAPTVQSLDQIMAELQPGYTAQRGVIQKGIQNTNETYKASELALDAAKTQGFNQINDQATGKGVGRAFSGLPIVEQADYLSTKYLPGLQQAKAQQQKDILTLEGQNAALDTDIRNRAFSSRENQIGAQNQWNLQQESQRAAAEAARIERDFRASEAQKERAHQAAQAAASRAAQAAAQPKGLSGSQLSAWAEKYVKSAGADGRKRQGIDGKIAPSEYYSGFSDFYTQTGLGQDEYMAIMSKYVNTSHAQDYRLF